MAFAYSEFDSTPANIIADLKTKILLSSDWSNPTGSVVQATAANGATMALDLVGGGAADNQRIRTKAYRLFSSGTGTDGIQRTLYWNRTGNLSTSPLHCKVSAGNTLLYIEIEGPRATETGTDSTSVGSQRQVLFLAQIDPYMSADTTPAVAFGGSSSYNGSESLNIQYPGSLVTYVSRNQAATVPWAPGRLYTVTVPVALKSINYAYNPVASDGSTYLFPYVLIEDSAGLRGRLTDLMFAGYVASTPNDPIIGLTPGVDITYNSQTYRTTAPYKTDGNVEVGGSLGAGGSTSALASPLVAVRKA